jgi:hypothetical protein
MQDLQNWQDDERHIDGERPVLATSYIRSQVSRFCSRLMHGFS